MEEAVSPPMRRMSASRVTEGRNMRKVEPRSAFRSAQMRPPCCMNDSAADRQAQTGPALLPRIGGIDLLEAVEDRFQLVLGNAAAVVYNADGDPVQQPLE